MLLSEPKLEVLSEITRDIGQVLFGSVFIAPLFSDTPNWVAIISGLILSLIFWSLSLLLSK